MNDKLAVLRHKQQLNQIASLERSMVSALGQVVKFLDGKTSKTEVVNQLKSVGTPDALKVVEAVNGLHSTLKTHKNTDLSEVSSLLKELLNKPHQEVKIPEQKDSVSVSNLKDVDFSKLEKAIKDLKLDGPTVNVDAPDLSPIKSGLGEVVNAIKAIVIPKPQAISTTKLETEAEKTNKILTDQTKKLQEIVDKPTGGGGGGGNGTPYINAAGKATYTNGVVSTTTPVVTAVAVVNPDGTNIAGGSGGSGTQYTEDAVAAADPVGTAVNLIRSDTPGALVSANGDNVAQRGTNFGAAYSQIVTSAGAFVDTFGGGSQFADGAARGTATGTLAMVDDGVNIQSLSGDSTGKLNVNNISGTVSLPTGAATETTLGTRLAEATFTTRIPVQGQATMAASIPVTIASNQSALPVTLASTTITGAVDTELTTADLDTGVGTDTRAVVGLAGQASGGAQLIGSTANALDINIKSGNPTQITANAGTNLNTSALALSATQTDGTQKAIARGGAKGTTVAGDLTSNPIDANTQALHVDGSKVTQPVSLATNTPTLQAGSTTTVTQATGTNLHAVIDSGSITANAGTNLNTSALALDATLTGGTAKAIARGGAKGTTVAGDLTSNPVDANTQALHVDGSKVVQPVSGPLTDAQLRAAVVPVSLTSTTITGSVAVTDNAGSLTVDAPVGTPVFVRLSDGAAAISTLPVSLASVPSHAVTNAGTFASQVTASATGGYTPAKLISAATTNATSVKASAGTIGYLTASNINASPRCLKIYNKASAPTVGTDVPVHTFIIPGNTAGAGTNIPLPPQGIALGTGIAFATTTGAADADTGAVASAELIINYGWI